jgi:exonuclease III
VACCLGPDYTQNFWYLPAEGTRGGVLLACKDVAYQFSNVNVRNFSVLVSITDSTTHSSWSLTGVYDPQNDMDKRLFLQELRSLKNVVHPAWIILGDFNLICLDNDKNNGRLNMRSVARFWRALNHLEVKEIPLLGKRFTWSNEQNVPTMSRIDWAFCMLPWKEIHLEPVLQPLSSSVSDHCPLLLHLQERPIHLPSSSSRIGHACPASQSAYSKHGPSRLLQRRMP